MQYKNPANRSLVLEGLKIADRMDLVGFGPKCLIRPERKNNDRLKEGRKGNPAKRSVKKTIRNTHKKKNR